MAESTPTLEQVLAAIEAQVETVSGAGEVRSYDHTFEDDAEFYEQFQDSSTGLLRLWIFDLESVEDREGEAPGEIYDIYNIRGRYWSCRVDEEDWSKQHRQHVAAVRTKLTENAAVFRIGGQRQVLPDSKETVTLRSHGKEPVSGQQLYQSEVALRVEARRWS